VTVPTHDPRARAAAALRRMGHALSAHDADPALLDRVAAAADRVTEELEATPPRTRDLLELKRRMFDVEVPDGEPVVHFDECFVSGPWNPLGIGIEVHREGDEAVATVQLGAAFEGAPGRSHGGIVAAIFDDVLGYLLTLENTPGFTGELTVRYHAPTPIHQPLEFRARLQRRDGRKLHTVAQARVADGPDAPVVASAEAVFIAVDPASFRA
jgi:acyl-coenzyme A thioesterase PaaI-like protein